MREYLVAPNKTATLASLLLAAAASALGGQSASGDDVELGAPPTRPYHWLEPTTWNLIPKVSAITVDTGNRAAVVTLFDTLYTPALSVPMGWTGSIAGCIAGTTSSAYIDATMDMINYFRAMSGLPGDVANAATFNDEAQEAALMMIAEGALSHMPGTGWACYTTAGADGAASSNLSLGNAGPSSIIAYMRDSGGSNYFVGHRRWILYPRQVQMGTGSTDGVNGFTGSNALYVFAGFGPRPGSPSVVSWPPAGFVPYQVVYPRWSFSLNSDPSADYSAATVTMTKDAANVPLSVNTPLNGFGDNTLVWEPSGLSFGAGQPAQTVSVSVSNVLIGGNPQSFNYDVTVIDPAFVSMSDADLSVTVDDSEDPAISGTGLVYTVTVSNAGPETADNVTVDDTLPSGVTLSATSGCTNDPSGVPTCTLGTLASGASTTFDVTVVVDAATTGNINNAVSVSSTTNDPNNGNDADAEDTLVNAPTSCSNGPVSLDSGDSTSDATILTKNSLTVGSGFQAFSGGTVHLRSASAITFTNDFTVDSGAVFVAAIDPLITCN